jgi:hypothetical protein
LGPQQAFASLQHASPSVQHFWTAEQQPLVSAQHFSPLSQQPSLASAIQQPLPGEQQARLAAQQSWAESEAEKPPNSRPKVRNDPAKSLVNIVISTKSRLE